MFDFTIHPTEANQTIISFLKKRFKTTPLSLIYKLFRTKKIKVAGEVIRYYHYRLKTGEEIVIDDNFLKPFNLISTLIPKKPKLSLKIIYEDKNILIVAKEHGITMPELDEVARYHFHQQNPNKY